MDVKNACAKARCSTVHGRARVTTNTIYNPEELLQNHEQQVEAKQKSKQVKEAAAKQQKKDEAEAKRLAMTCAVDGCIKRTYKKEGSTDWRYCVECKKLFCNYHASNYLEHAQLHKQSIPLCSVANELHDYMYR